MDILYGCIKVFVFLSCFREAYEIACLGITTSEWEQLGFAALEKLSLDVAKKAFQRCENILYLQLIDSLKVYYIYI